MKSKTLFLVVLTFFLAKPIYCFSQSDTVNIEMPYCCPGENRDEYFQAFYPEDDCSVCALIDGLSEITELFGILLKSSSRVDENNIEKDWTTKTNVRAKIGDRMEIETATIYESIFDSDDNDASSFSGFISMTFSADNNHTFKLYSEFIEFYTLNDDTQVSTKMKYWIRNNNKEIYFHYSINDVVSSAKINNEAEVYQLFGQISEYLKNLGCEVEMQKLETTRSGKTEIVNQVCVCAEITKFKENVKLIE